MPAEGRSNPIVELGAGLDSLIVCGLAGERRELPQQRIHSGDLVKTTLPAGSATAIQKVGQRSELGPAGELGGVGSRQLQRLVEQPVNVV